MIEDLKQVRDALSDSKAEFWDDWHPSMSEGDFENHWLIMDIDKSLATLDRIIADHIPDASKIVVPDGYALVPIEPTRKMWLAGIKHQQEYKASYTVESTYRAMVSAAPTPSQPEDNIRKMMQDPKYWRDRDPETIKKVSAAFNELYGVPTTPAQPEKVDVEALKREVNNLKLSWMKHDEDTTSSDDLIDHLASAGYLRAPLPRIEGALEKLLRQFSIQNLSSEMDEEALERADFQSAYDMFINKTRAYLKASGV